VHSSNDIVGQTERLDDGGDLDAFASGSVRCMRFRQRRDEFASRRDDAAVFGAVVMIFGSRRCHLAELHNVPVRTITVIIRADFGPVARPDSAWA
jgi:hypothetical protein